VAAAKNSLEDGAISGHTTKLKQSLFFRYLWFNRKLTVGSSEKENKLKILEKKIERESKSDKHFLMTKNSYCKKWQSLGACLS
jgi:hypothetical protein